MKQIITDIESINTLKSSIIIFFPDGELIAIEKIQDLNYHIEYLKILYQYDEKIRDILSDINIKYYLKHPDEWTEIISKFAENNCAVYINVSPHIINPTDMATVWLPQEKNKKIQEVLNRMKEKFSPIIFLGIGEYNPDTKYFDSKLETFEMRKNSEIFYNIINNGEENKLPNTNNYMLKKLGLKG